MRRLVSLLLAIPFFLSTTSCKGSTSDSTVARVNSEAITAEDLRGRLHEYQVNETPDSSPEARVFRKRVLNELIEERVLLAEAKSRNIVIQPAELNAALEEVEKDYGKSAFNKVLTDKRMTRARWRDRMRLKLTLDKVIQSITKDVQPPSDATIAAFYQKHPEQFQRPEQIHVAQIVVRTSEDGERILAELKKKTPFEELARTHSFTPEASQGGDLGFVEKGIMPPPLEKAFWKLRVGKTTPVIQTDYGYHVVRVLERRAKHLQTLEEAKPQILRVLTQRDREKTFSVWRREALSRAKIERNHALLEKIN